MGDPIAATDEYAAHMIRCQEMIAGPCLRAAFRRRAAHALRTPQPRMLRIPLEMHIVAIHPDDAGPLVANALGEEAV